MPVRSSARKSSRKKQGIARKMHSCVGRLFEILAQPGLGNSDSYLEDRFRTPDYLYKWSISETLLHKFEYNRLLGCYLYHQKINRGRSIKAQRMEELSGLSFATIKTSYNYFERNNKLDAIEKAFQAFGNDYVFFESPKISEIKEQYDIKPELLQIYDELASIRRMHPKLRPQMTKWIKNRCTELGVPMSLQRFYIWCKLIPERGYRSPLPPAMSMQEYCDNTSRPPNLKNVQVFERYNEIRDEMRRNQLRPEQHIILSQIAKEQHTSKKAVYQYYIKWRKYYRKGYFVYNGIIFRPEDKKHIPKWIEMGLLEEEKS